MMPYYTYNASLIPGNQVKLIVVRRSLPNISRGAYPLSAPIRNYGNILAVIFFPLRALSIEWIRFLTAFLDRIYRII